MVMGAGIPSAVAQVVSAMRNVEVYMYDEGTRTQLGSFEVKGELDFADGGQKVSVPTGTSVSNFVYKDYRPGKMAIRSEGKFFLLDSGTRRFSVYFPSLGPSAVVKELEQKRPSAK
jgi:hypothetical protein